MRYISEALETETKDYALPLRRLERSGSARILHATMGLCTEAAEALDAVKKHIFYGKELDRTNLKEELGDLFWYAAILADELDVSFEEIQRTNIRKLKSRYRDGFSEGEAVHRDLEKEKKTLSSPFRIATRKELKELKI